MSDEPLLPGKNDSSEEDDLQIEHTEEELASLIRDLPEPQQKAVQAVLIAMENRTHWRGPLPPPDKLKAYNEALPDGAERILKMAENQSQHRINIEAKAIPEEQRQSRHGQIYAFILALSFLIVSAILIWQGHDVAGTVLGSVDLVALVTVFIYGRNSQKKESTRD